VLEGSADHSRGDPQIIVDCIIPIDEAATMFASAVRVEIDCDDERESVGLLNQLSGLCKAAGASGANGSANSVPLSIALHRAGKRIVMDSQRVRIAPTKQVLGDLQRIVGSVDRVTVLGGRTIGAPAKRERRWSRRTEVPNGHAASAAT